MLKNIFKVKGFTLIELLIVVAMMLMTMAIGLPSFQSIITSTRLTSAANAMVSALQLARTEALKQHKSIVIRPKNGTSSNWSQGWEVFVDLPKGSPPEYNHTLDSDETIFSTFNAPSSTITVTATPAYANYVNYGASGRVNIAGHFTFCSGTEYRSVVIANTGRIRVETPTSCS